MTQKNSRVGEDTNLLTTMNCQRNFGNARASYLCLKPNLRGDNAALGPIVALWVLVTIGDFVVEFGVLTR